MKNPLLIDSALPHFSEIKTDHIEPAIDALLAEARSVVSACLASTQNYTWENLIEPIDNVEDKLNKAWSPVSHMNSVINSEALREAY
ncbi:MAG: oligopeptidase A, partial [Methylicorpusculum sp.]|nr:oligopeptidase A [Methylicorpusculum sp.]